MKKINLPLITILLALGSQAHGAIVQYTDRGAFLAALAGEYVTTDFSSLSPGDVQSTTLSIFGINPVAALILESRDSSDTFAGNNLWVSDNGDLDNAVGASTSYTDLLRLTSASGGFYAIGADWFLGDIDDNYLAGSVTLTFSDNSTYTISSTSQAESFSGFISDSPLTHVTVSAANPESVAGWASIDNLATVPEPSSTLLAGLVGIGALLKRRRLA